jgi:hypothetical protein
VYDSHPSPVTAVFRMESMSLDIIIGTYLAVVWDDQAVSTEDVRRTYTCIPLEYANHPSARTGGWRVSLDFLRKKTTLTLLVSPEQPAVNPKIGQRRNKSNCGGARSKPYHLLDPR